MVAAGIVRGSVWFSYNFIAIAVVVVIIVVVQLLNAAWHDCTWHHLAIPISIRVAILGVTLGIILQPGCIKRIDGIYTQKREENTRNRIGWFHEWSYFYRKDTTTSY